MPMGRRSDVRRTMIAEAALAAMLERGYTGTTIGDLARELGISKAAISYYFPAKQDFLAEFVGPLLDELEESVPIVPRPVWPHDARTVVGAFYDVLVRHREIAVWLDRDPAVTNIAEYADRYRAITERVVDSIIGRGRRRGSDVARSYAALGGIWRPVRELPIASLRAHRDEIIDAALVSYEPLAPAEPPKS